MLHAVLEGRFMELAPRPPFANAGRLRRTTRRRTDGCNYAKGGYVIKALRGHVSPDNWAWPARH